jgi:hypothetical protein
MGEKNFGRPLSVLRPFSGLLLLAFIVFVLIVFWPKLNRWLSAADLAYLWRDGRYLILLQNNAELRATGGFIGSFAEVEVKTGHPVSIEFGTNIYKLDDPFVKKVAIPAPSPLARLTHGKWSFHDSNWAADGEEALRQAVWFYERETSLAGQGRKVDGVIALTTTVVEELLRLVGPIEMPGYATTLTADNFAEVVQYKVEKEYYENRANWPVDEPKTILRDLIPILEERLKAADKTRLINLGFRLLDQKYIVLYAKNPLAQKIILNKNWGGAVDRTWGNYLYLVNSNVDGGKSSRKIKERVFYSQDTKKRQVTLHVEREHTGSGIWPDNVNRNWLRVLVPKGSQLVALPTILKDEKVNIDISEEAGKTVFGLWINTNPQEIQDLTLVYQPPSDVSLSVLIVQRQPGANPDELRVVVDGIEKFRGIVEQDTTIEL